MSIIDKLHYYPKKIMPNPIFEFFEILSFKVDNNEIKKGDVQIFLKLCQAIKIIAENNDIFRTYHGHTDIASIDIDHEIESHDEFDEFRFSELCQAGEKLAIYEATSIY
jgi:hypothetical protein